MIFNREYPKGAWFLVAFIVGAALALVMVPVLARTAALAAPASLFAWFTGHGLAGLGSFLWSALVVYGLSIALPAAALLLVLFRLSPSGRAALAMWFGLGVLFLAYVWLPLYSGQPDISLFMLPWWQQGLVASLLLGLGLALGIARVFRMAQSPGVSPQARAV